MEKIAVEPDGIDTMRSQIGAILGLFVALTTVQSASGGMIVVDNLAQIAPPYGGIAISGHSYNSSTGQYETTSIAGSFIVGAGVWEIEGITIRVNEWDNPLDINNPDTMLLRILTDNAGTPGSTVVGTLLPTTNIYQLSNYQFAPTGDITLSEGKYWLAAFPTATGTQLSSLYSWWNTGSGVDNGINGWSIDNRFWASPNLGATWVQQDFVGIHNLMYRIEAAPVPEPSSLILVLGGVAMAFARCRPRVC